jgi:hypothetical protein
MMTKMCFWAHLKNNLLTTRYIFKRQHLSCYPIFIITHINMIAESWDSSVGIATDYRLNGWGLIPGMGKIFLSSKESRLASWLMGTGDYFPWDRATGV